MTLERTIYDNYKLIVDEFGIIVGVQIDGEVAFRLHDIVEVTDDGLGYICPGVNHAGLGKIAEIQRDDTDYFFGVQMDNGEFGYMKDSRIKVIEKHPAYNF